MKYCISNIKLIFVSLLLSAAGQLFAQQEVTSGSTHTYSVTPIPVSANYDYNWSITPGGTSSVFGTGASNNITWDGAPGIYTITVYPSKPASACQGASQTLSVTVVDMHIQWADDSSVQCPKTQNETGNFTLTVNYTGISGDWSFTYNIDGMTSQTVNVTTGNTLDIDIPGFVNASNTTPVAHVVQITSVTNADNYTVNYDGFESDAALHICTVTIEPTPNTSGINAL